MNKIKIIAVAAALGALLSAAYIAPRFVDQSSLRAWVGPELQRALRQGVAIDGAIDFALLPRPMVQARQIRVTRQDRKIADIPEIEATLKIWPLLIGRMEPDQLVLSRPDIHLDALPPANPPATGAPAAPPAPAGQSTAPAEAPVSAAAFKNFAPKDIGRVVIEKGSLSLPGLTLSPVDLKIVTGEDSLSLSGRLGAGRTGVQIDGDAHWLDGRLQSTNLALRVDGGTVLRWTGQGDPLSADHPLAGKLTARMDDPAALLGERAPAVPIGFSGDLTIRPGQVDAANLLLTLGDAEFRGDGQFISGDMPHAALRLHAGTLDLAKMPSSSPARPAPAAPAAGLSLPPPPALTPPASPEPRRPLPFLHDASIQLSLSADQILWRGKILQDARLDMASVNGELTVNQAGVTLPGNSQISLVGSIAEDSRFVGSFEAKSDDLRELLHWADLDPMRVPADRLRAARLAGHLRGDFDEITLEGVRLKLDSSILDFSAAIRPGPRPAVGLTFALDSLNGDAYWPPVAPAPEPGASAPAAESAGPAAPAPPPKKPGVGLDAEVHGHIGHLIWRGQNVNDVAIDSTFTADGIAVRSLTAGDLAGAQVSVTGAVSQTETGWRIDHAKANLHSRDIARTLRNLGVDLPLDGQADLSADLSGPWAQPAMTVSAPMLNIGKVYLDHVMVNVALPPGRVVFDHLTAGLYGGQLTGEGGIARDGGVSTLHLTLAGAQMKKALLEVADIGLADGEMAAAIDLTSSGKPSEMEANLAGTGSLSVKNGQIHGFDLKAANDRLKGQQGIGGLLALLQAGLTGGDTHFSSLTGTAKAEHGVIVTNDVKLEAEGGDATGVANISLPADTIDAHADFHFANAHDAPPLTMRLQGALHSPHRYLDVKPLQQWLADHGVKTGKPKDVLKGLLQGLTK